MRLRPWSASRPRFRRKSVWLGAQAGEAHLKKVVMEGGFKRFRRAAETPFNMVLEARL
jgi:hypothetical protein